MGTENTSRCMSLVIARSFFNLPFNHMRVTGKRSLKVASLFLVPRYFVNNFIIAHKSLCLLFISFTY